MRVLFAWEMGHNFGHAAQIAAVAAALAKKRAEIWMAMKNPAAGVPFTKDFPCRILQAPYHPIKRSKRPPPLTYAEGLLPCGYDDADNLYPLIESWRSLFDLVKPDVLVTQAAPTALLAARGAKFGKLAFGKGFDVPPIMAPMPALPYWKKNDEDAIKRNEVAIINVINKALVKAKLKPVKKFCEMFEEAENMLCVIPEFDHYPKRESMEYYGGIFEAGNGEKVDWRKGDAKRIFAYLQPDMPVSRAAGEALRRLKDHDVILAAPGLPPEAAKKLETPNLRIICGPVRLDHLLKKCDLAINHAGGGLCSALALAGVPILMLPLHIEQLMFARAVGRSGMGRALVGAVRPEHISAKIREMLEDKKFKQAAQAIAAKHKNESPEKTAKIVAEHIMKLAK